MLSYPSGMTVSNRALIMLADLLRAHRTQLRTRWRRLDAGQQALLTVAHLRKGRDLRLPSAVTTYVHRVGDTPWGVPSRRLLLAVLISTSDEIKGCGAGGRPGQSTTIIRSRGPDD